MRVAKPVRLEATMPKTARRSTEPVVLDKPAPLNNRALQAKQTRERIVQRSILLFNRKNIQSVSVDQIATALKISPGNLTYHFARKHELISAALVLLQERLRSELGRPITIVSPLEGAAFLVTVFRTLWQFRFFFNGLTYVVTMDPQLRKDFLEFRDWVIDTLEADCRHFSAQGYILPETPPNSYRLLAENVWGHWLSWLRMQQIESPLAPTPENEALYDCALHQWSMSQHWLKPGFSEDLLEAFRSVLQSAPGKSR